MCPLCQKSLCVSKQVVPLPSISVARPFGLSQKLVPSSSQAAQLQRCFQPFSVPQHSCSLPCKADPVVRLLAGPHSDPHKAEMASESSGKLLSTTILVGPPPPHASIQSALPSSSFQAVSPSPLCLPHSQVLQRLCFLSLSSSFLCVTHTKQR